MCWEASKVKNEMVTTVEKRGTRKTTSRSRLSTIPKKRKKRVRRAGLPPKLPQSRVCPIQAKDRSSKDFTPLSTFTYDTIIFSSIFHDGAKISTMMTRLLALLCALFISIGVVIATDDAGTEYLEAKVSCH